MHKPKHYEYNTTNITALGSNVTVFSEQVPEAVNVHGLRGEISFFNPGGVATAHGVNWALMCLPEFLDGSTIGLDDTEFNSDTLQSFIWASGKVVVPGSNAVNPVLLELGTSRNCEKGSRVILMVRWQSSTGAPGTLNIFCGITWWETQT